MAALLTCLPAAMPAAAPPGDLRFERERTTAITMALAPAAVRSTVMAPIGLVWRGRVLHREPVAVMRLHLTIQGPPAGWRLKIWSEETGLVVQTIEAAPGTLAAEGLWTRDVPGRAALVDLELTSRGQAPDVGIDQYGYDIRPSIQQAIHGIDGRLAIKDASHRIQDLGKSVGRLRIMVPGLGQATCTGFLIADRLMLTNEHCVTSKADARATLVDFGYDEPGTAATETLEAVELEAVNRELDYAVIRLERQPAAAFTPVAFSRDSAAAGQQLVVVQHPLGGYKQVSLESCEVSDVSMRGVTAALSDFGHRCDTLNGSSGSPVLDYASGKIVGLHHLGFDPDTNTLINRAVQIGLVLADIRKQRPTLIPVQ